MPIDLSDPTPLYLQIAEDIRTKITSREFRIGDKLASQADLASEYHVSLMTIKKATAELIKEGFLFSRVGKGTFVAQRSKPIDFSKQKTIGLVLQDLKSPFFSPIIHSVEKAGYEKGYNILLSNSSGRIEKEEAQIQHFRQIGVSALIIASMTRFYHATPTIRTLHEENFPYVIVSYIEDEDIRYVGTDHEAGAFIATEYLIQRGYERIGYINGEEENLLGELRKKGYMRALDQYGKPFREAFVFRFPFKGEWNDYKSGYEIGKRFLNLSEKPDAIFAYNDLAALGFEKAILDHGLKVPDDVGIIGFDDIERCQYAPVPLTTVRQPTIEIGSVAVDIVIKRIKGQETSTRIILKPKLIIRESC